MYHLLHQSRIQVVIIVVLLMMAGAIAAQPPVEFFRLGVKERIVDSLWALQQTQPVDTSLLDSIRSPFKIGVQASSPTVSMAYGSGTLWIHADANAAASGSPAVVIDSMLLFGETVRDHGMISASASLAPSVSRWLAEHGAVRLKRVFADAMPGQTFTAYRRNGPILRDLSIYYEIEFDTPQTIESLIDNLGAVSGIEAAYPVAIPIPTTDVQPDHSACVMTAAYIDSQYYLRPPTATSAGIDAFGAWLAACRVLQEAPPVVIGIHDRGFGSDPSWHPNIRGAIETGSRASFNNLNVHGTKVASVAGATWPNPEQAIACTTCRLNSQGVLGVLPTARMVISERPDLLSDILPTLKYLVDSTPAKVINMSWGTTKDDSALNALLDYAYFEKGIVLVAGSGNCGAMSYGCTTLVWPGAHPAVIAVGSIKPDRSLRSEFSNTGFQLLLAPGENIFSAGGTPKFPDSIAANYGYGIGKGTSYSAPMVTAIAALIRQARPDISYASIADILASASTHKTRPFGWYSDEGYGLVNARSAVEAAIQTRCVNIPGDVNKDCYVNYGDVQMLADYLFDLRPLASPLNAEVDSNCIIDITDLSLLISYAFLGWPNQLKVGCLVPNPRELTVEKAAVSEELLPSLGSNYPNPFNPLTTIEFSVPIATDYTLRILNITGQDVAKMSGLALEGVNKILWDGSGVASGVYVYQLEIGSFSQSRKMVLLK